MNKPSFVQVLLNFSSVLELIYSTFTEREKVVFPPPRHQSPCLEQAGRSPMAQKSRNTQLTSLSDWFLSILYSMQIYALFLYSWIPM